MKNVFSFVFAGLVGGAAALGGATLLQSGDAENASALSQEITSEQRPVAFTSSPSAATSLPSSFTDAVKEVMPTVVHIRSIKEVQPRTIRERRFYEFFGQPQPSKSTGSGVIISEKGYVVTNNHVVEGATEVEVTLHDKRKYKAEVLGTDPSTDLAVLKVDAPDLQPIKLSNSDNAEVGEWVLAVGNPFDLASTVTAGIISAKGRDISILEGQYAIESFIQTDAAVNPGNSGGALVNTRGELVGINTAIATPTGTYAGYSFAVPVNLTKKVVQDIIDYGKVRRGYLGVTILELDNRIAEELGLSTNNGVYVNKVLDNSGANAAGLREGDVIVGVEGQEITSPNELQEKVGSRNPGDYVDLTIIRDGRRQTLSAQLQE